MSSKRPVSEVDIPDVERCPNCGELILLGDMECPNCGQNVASLEQQIRQLDPITIAITLGIMGIFVSVSALTMDGLLQVIVLLAGLGLFLSGGAAVVGHYFFNDPLRRRKRD